MLDTNMQIFSLSCIPCGIIVFALSSHVSIWGPVWPPKNIIKPLGMRCAVACAAFEEFCLMTLVNVSTTVANRFSLPAIRAAAFTVAFTCCIGGGIAAAAAAGMASPV